MKTILFSFAFILMLHAGLSRTVSSDSSYLGQTPPGNIPEIFAPGIISLANRLETYPTFSPDGKELFFSVANAAWTSPVIMGADINTTGDEYGPRVTADGKYLFFTRENPGNSLYIYWASAVIIDSLKNSVLSSVPPTFKHNIQIFPNPANTRVNILFGASTYKNALLKLTDMEGKLIRSETYHGIPAITINFSGYPKGTYILSLHVDGEIHYKKIVH